MAPQIPTFYRIWFTIVDPLFTLLGIYSMVFNPKTVLNSYSPTYISPPSSETVLLLDVKAAFLVGLLYLQLVLLRARPTDVTVWRALQASTLLVDLGMLAAFARALSVQGRMDARLLRVEEWGNYAITAGLAVVRSSFLVGVRAGARKGKRA